MAYRQANQWSWLTTQESRSEIYCPPGLEVGLEQFAAELQRQIKENDLPAKAELVTVNWEDVGTSQDRILVQLTKKSGPSDVIQYVVGLDKMGRFTYVEEKVCLKPPVLCPLTIRITHC